MDKNLNTIRIFDSNFAHAKYSTDFQESKYIIWDRLKSFSEDEVVFYTDNFLKNNNRLKNSYAWLLEPNSISPNTYEYIKNNYHKFEKILTYDKDLLDINEKFIFFPHGGCWIQPEKQKIYEKNKLLSIISSNKKITKGHKLRHEVINKFGNLMSIYGRGYNPIKYKLEGLKDFMFSIVIENMKKDFYFTEKLIDCFMTGTIPIYYGCPSIGNFFDSKGVLSFETIEELNDIINKLSENLYNDKIQSIKNNFNIAKNYLISEDWIYENINIL